MGVLAVGEAVGGIIGGIALVAVFTIWIWRWREHTRVEIAALKEQVAGLKQVANEIALLSKRVTDNEFTMIKGLANVNLALEALEKDVAQLRTEMDEQNAVSEKQAVINTSLTSVYKDVEIRTLDLWKQVQELNKGWVRFSGGRKTE